MPTKKHPVKPRAEKTSPEGKLSPPEHPPVSRNTQGLSAVEGVAEKIGPAGRIKVTLECPCCGRSFRHSVSKAALGAGGITLKCPHCGSEGEI